MIRRLLLLFLLLPYLASPSRASLLNKTGKCNKDKDAREAAGILMEMKSDIRWEDQSQSPEDPKTGSSASDEKWGIIFDKEGALCYDWPPIDTMKEFLTVIPVLDRYSELRRTHLPVYPHTSKLKTQRNVILKHLRLRLFIACLGQETFMKLFGGLRPSSMGRYLCPIGHDDLIKMVSERSLQEKVINAITKSREIADAETESHIKSRKRRQ